MAVFRYRLRALFSALYCGEIRSVMTDSKLPQYPREIYDVINRRHLCTVSTGVFETITMYTWFLLLLVLICLHGVFVSLYWRARKYLKDLPSYSQLPFLGSMHWFLGGGETVFRRLTEISTIMDKTNLPFVVWIGPRPLMLLSNPDDVRTVTNAFLDKPYFYNFARDWLGEGLVLVPGEVWKHNVKKIAGSFTGSMVDGFQAAFNSKAQELVLSFQAQAGKEPFDAMPYLSYMTLRAICQTGLGVNYTSDSEITKDYHEAFTTALELMIKRGTNWLLHFDCLYRLTADHRKFLRALAVMHRLSDRVIKEKQLERDLMKRNSDTNTVRTENSNPSGFKTVLDMLLDMSETDHMSESQLRSEVNTIIVGGQDTVAATLYYTLLMLGSNADVQDRLYAEVKQVFRNKGTIDKEALSSLVYCDAVISETLRLYPPIPAVTRYADRDLDIRCCKIPKGTFCSLNLWGAGRSVRAWGPDAHRYRPERWLPSNTPSAASYMPFSAGRRACIGKRYAMVLLKTVLAHCVQNLIFISEAEKLEFKMDVGLRATNGYLLQVKLRT